MTYVHLKTSKDFKQRKELLSKALVRATIEQLGNTGTVQEVWVKANGREALIKFTYKDSARRVIA